MGIFGPNIGKMKENRDIKGLIKALKHSNAKVRADVAIALGELGDEHAVEPLIRVLKDIDETVRGSVAVALGELGDEHAVEPLIEALKDLDAAVRCSAAFALGKIGDKCAVEPLIEALKDSAKQVRRDAVVALGEIGDPKALGTLEMLKDDRTLVHDPSTNKLISTDAIASEAINKIKEKRQLELEPERKQQYIVNVIGELLRKEANFFVDDIKNSLSKGDIEGAEKLLEEKKGMYTRWLELRSSLKDVDDKTTKLSSKLAEGNLPADAYERARDDLEREKADIDEELWKIQQKIFREKYEKPF